VLEVFLKLSHNLYFTGLFSFRVISPPPFARFQFTLIWISARCILCPLFHFVREPYLSTDELVEIQISHEDMLVVSNAFWKFLAPTRTIHMNTKTKGLLIKPGTFVQPQKIPCQKWLFPKAANYSVCISNEGREEERDSTASADRVLQPVCRSFSRLFGQSVGRLIGRSVGRSFLQCFSVFCIFNDPDYQTGLSGTARSSAMDIGSKFGFDCVSAIDMSRSGNMFFVWYTVL
jgi:hypothetical protein